MPLIARGIDHIGVTVFDLAEAHRFLVDGLGAELLYDLLDPDQLPLSGTEVEQLIEAPRGARIDAIRMYKVGEGAAIELFHYVVEDQRPSARGSDLGLQHFALYVDDMEAAIERLVAAGGKLMAEPWEMIGRESGAGNRLCFVKAPFGTLIELVTCPSPQEYQRGTNLSRWRPQAASAPA